MKTESYKIQILTDANSWISPYIKRLACSLEDCGHKVLIAHDILYISPSDFCFCLSFSRLVPKSVREYFRHTLVVHESDLPRGRGWAPFTWQILEGCSQIAVTLIEAVDEVDAGPIYLQEWLDLSGNELCSEWRDMQGRATERLCLKWVASYPSIITLAREQSGDATFYPRRKPRDSRFDPNKSIAEQFNLLRVVDNDSYPAYFEHKGRNYRIKIEPID